MKGSRGSNTPSRLLLDLPLASKYVRVAPFRLRWGVGAAVLQGRARGREPGSCRSEPEPPAVVQPGLICTTGRTG